MGESRARTGFGQVDLQMDESTDDAFGELDWDFPESSPPEPAQPSSTVQPASGPNVSSKKTVRREDAEMEAVVDSTRIVPSSAVPKIEEERDTSSRVEPKNDRVAAMREAYARGDAEGALAIANAMEGVTMPPPAPTPAAEARSTPEEQPPTVPPPAPPPTMPPPAGGIDHPDAAVDVEIGEETEIDIDEEEPVHAKDLTRIVAAPMSPGAQPAPALGSLTERHGIPRVLLGPQEISKLPIDHRAGFLLGFIDGMQTMEEILDVCAMPPNEALELIRSLVDMGVIEIE